MIVEVNRATVIVDEDGPEPGVRFIIEMDDAEMATKLATPLELQLEIRWCGLTVSLVTRVDSITERRRQTLIECHCEIGRLRSLDQIAQESGKTKHGVRRITVAINHVGRHRVIGAEYVDRRIDEVDHEVWPCRSVS